MKTCEAIRGYLPIIIDLETSGVDPTKHAILELAYAFVDLKDDVWQLDSTKNYHIKAFEGAEFDKEAMELNKIDPDYPLRFAQSEEEILKDFFALVSAKLKSTKCSRAILVGHNAWFDLAFLNAMVERTKLKSPFHKFSTIDTVTLGAMFCQHTVLAEIAMRLGLPYKKDCAHTALYDVELTYKIFAKLFVPVKKNN